MTVVELEALERLLGTPGPVSNGQVRAEYWAGTRPFVKVDGATVTFPPPIRVKIEDGAPAETIDLQPTDDVCCVRWVIQSGGFALRWYTSIPDTGPVDFGDLPVVDPALFTSADVPPTLLETLQDLAWDRF